MKRSVVGCVVMVLACAVSVRAESGLLKRGLFDSIKPEMGGLITLRFEKSSIRLDRSVWGEEKEQEVINGAAPVNPAAAARIRRIQQSPAEAAFRRLQVVAQANQTSGMTSNNIRSISFTGASLSGKLEVAADVVTIRLAEAAEPRRTLELIENPDGMFRLLLTGEDGDLVLINQSQTGAASVACVVGDKSAVASGQSFAEVFSKNREVFEKIVFPALEHVGVQLALSANTPQVRAAVVAMLTPLGEEDRQTAQKLLAELSSPDFATREVARERLAAGIDRYRPAIEQHAAKKELSNDVRFTLDQLLSVSNADPTRKLVTEMKLLDDAKFLVSILDAIEPESRKVVTARIEKLTGKSFGEDVSAWQKWAAEN